MLNAAWGVRTLATSSRMCASDLIQDLFVRNVRLLGEQVKSGKLFQTKEVTGLVENELNRIAKKFHMDNYQSTRSLPIAFDEPQVDSAVQKILAGKNLDEMIANVKKDISKCEEKRRVKAEEDKRFAVLNEFDTYRMGSFTSNAKKEQ
uniref:ATP synthase-coupling factor 6, mitochondrial n=1 Tax=Syphacia muris TaxID=451379 RepID=A0A0N5AIG3_9BILA